MLSFPAECSVSGNILMGSSVDTHPIPETECETVLAMDCSPKKYYAIMVASYPEQPSMKVLRMLLLTKVVKVIPQEGEVPMVHVDGEQKTLHISQPIIIKER